MKRKIIHIILGFSLLIFLFSISPSHAYRTDYVYPIGDAKVWKYSNATNYGSDPISSFGNMTIWGLDDDEAIGFFKFDMSEFDPDLAIEEEMQYVTLTFDLYVHSYYDWHEGETNFFTLGFSTNQTWDESSITWLDQPSFTETNEDVYVDQEDVYFSWNLAEIGNDVIDAIDEDKNFTIVITYDGFITQGFSGRMREYGGLSSDPRISIEYNIVRGEEPQYERDIVLSEFPFALGEALHIGDFGGQMLASLIIALMFMLPTFYACRGMRDNTLPVMIIGILVYGFLIAIRFLPVWSLLILIMAIAMLYANKIKGWIGK